MSKKKRETAYRMSDREDFKFINPNAKPLTPEQLKKLANLKLPPPDFNNKAKEKTEEK
jgi:hypothetical protein